MKLKLMPRILISLIGVAFILWGSMSATLGIFGEQTTAAITHIRREGSERSDIMPNRYTYNISYTFTLPEGKEIHGFVKKIGTAVYSKADGTGRISVHYFKEMPYINSSTEDAQQPIRQVILIGIGIFLIFLMNGKLKDSCETSKTIEKRSKG